MHKSSHILCIITARGGSKRLPGKNIKLLLGKPLIAYGIEAAKKSKYIDRVIVSTDSEEIAAVARGYGAEVPFMRPMELAQDDTPSVPVLQHAVNVVEEAGDTVDIMVLVQPTSPLVLASDIDAAIEKLVASGAPTCVSVSESTGKLNGAVYAVRRTALMEGDTVNNQKDGTTLPMPAERSVDVDTEEDFRMAESYLRSKQPLTKQ